MKEKETEFDSLLTKAKATVGPLHIAVTHSSYAVDLVWHVAPQNTVSYHRVAAGIVHPAALVGGRVTTECAVGHRQEAVGVPHTGPEIRRVTCKNTIAYCRVAADVQHPAATAVLRRRVADEHAVRHGEIAAARVIDPAALTGNVLAKRAPDHCPDADNVVHRAADMHG